MPAAAAEEPRPPLWKVWILASRPHTLTASLSPCLLGYTIASVLLHSPHALSLFFYWFSFCISIQLATNLHNDYADFVKGADTKERVGQARATQKGWLTPTQTATGATACLGVALGIGCIALQRDDYTDGKMWFILLSSMFNAVAYTGGPYPLGYVGLGHVSIAYWGLGEVFCILYFGLVATLVIPYLALRLEEHELLEDDDHYFQTIPIMTSLIPYALVPVFMSCAIIVVNNTRDRQTDILANKRTLAVRFGALFCKWEYTLLIVATYTSLVHHCIQQHTLWHLLPLVTIPLAIKCLQAIWRLEGRALNPFVGKTALCELLICVLQCVAIMKVGNNNNDNNKAL